MNSLDLILARNGIVTTIQKMRNSADEIKAGKPNRTDLIESLERSIADLTNSYVFFCELEAEYRAARQRNSDLEFSKFSDIAELNALREQNERLKAGL